MEAKCYKHPDEDALYQCYLCGRLICADCMIFQEDDDEVCCPECTLETAIQLSGEEADESLRRTRERKRKALQIRPKDSDKRFKLAKPVLVILFLLITPLNFMLGWFFQTDEQDIVNLSNGLFVKFGNPAAEMMFLTSRIFRYQQDHNGKFPEELKDLYPDYIDRLPRILDSDIDYGYRLDDREGFEISCPVPTKYKFRMLTITEDGILRIE